ncbi:MAG: glucosyltransferase domain-containing protein [Eubacteriales bacterium]|nr:glucosyltransferase domain-containing protein [Eubacteriales bacterium]
MEEGRRFLRSFRGFAWCLAAAVAAVYGLRVFHDNIFLDSEIMILRPEYMQQVWLGSNRFGMVLTNRLFGLGRLVPYLSGILMMGTMWCCGMALAFCSREWSGRSARYDAFSRLFPVLFVTMPVFAEQYLFLLQEFEIAFGILLTIAASYCAGQAVCAGNGQSRGRTLGFGLSGLLCMVWAFGTYQIFMPLYICLVLISFLLMYMNGRADQAFSMGIRHVLYFVLGCALYGAAVVLVRRAVHADSTYISDMVRWKADGVHVCLHAIAAQIRRVLTAGSLFHQKYYFPAMCLFTVQCMYYGWKEKKNPGNYVCFLFGGGLLLLSPFFLSFVTGGAQPVRAELVYPAAAAVFLAHLTVPAKEYKKKTVCFPGRRTVRLMCLICVLAAMRQGVMTVQLFQSSWEAYRNDVIAAVQMYPEICETADTEDMSRCMVIFTGGRDAKVQGPAVRGELAGLSLFEAEAHTAVGVTGRVGTLFRILGMEMQVLQGDQKELYWQADAFMADSPGWPAKGSIRKMGDIVVVKLSESRLPPGTVPAG